MFTFQQESAMLVRDVLQAFQIRDFERCHRDSRRYFALFSFRNI